MLRSTLAIPVVSLITAVPLLGQELPVKRVTLFSSGVAYYERSGQIDGDVTIELPFKTDQINDILKSLVLQDLGGGMIRPVVYAPKDPIDKALASFGIDLTGKPTLAKLLDQIRGVPVELTPVGQPKPIKGTILGVEKQRTFVDKQVIDHDVLNVLCDDGIRSYRLSDLARVKLADAKLEEELRKALTVLAGAHDADKKPVVLEFAGQGRRPVRVSYILEAPIWKTSYRLVLGDDPPWLQGWATVDNTTDEDWNGVQLTLVSGRPISFIQDLYEPLYVPRPEVKPELYASLVPREHEGAMELDEDKKMAAAPRRRGRKEARALRGEAVERLGEGMLFKRQAGMAAAGIAPKEIRLGIALAGAGVVSVATAAEAGELFQYAIETPVTLPRRKSAMLPIANEAVKGERFSIYNPTVHAKYPLNGLRLENATGLHLMQGPVTVFEDGTYAGDAQLPDMTPGETRLLSYSLDLQREVETVSKSQLSSATLVRIVKGTLIVTRKHTDTKTYNIKSKDDDPRSLLIEHPFRADWKLVAPKDPFERTPQVYRFRVDLKPRETTKLEVREERSGDEFIALRDTGLDTIALYLKGRDLSNKVRDALEKVQQMRTTLDRTRRQKQQLEARVNEITRDQARLRDNIRTVRQASDLYTRYIRKLEAQETELEDAREQITRLTQQENQQRKALEDYLLALSVE